MILICSLDRIKCRIPGTRPTWPPVSFTRELLCQIMIFHFSDSPVNMFAKSVVKILAESLVNMLAESLVNTLAESLVNMFG